MQENKQFDAHKRGRIIIEESIVLAVIILTCLFAKFKVSQFDRQIAKENEEMKVALEEYKTKQQLQVMTEQYRNFMIEVDKKIEEAKVTKKNVTPSAVTYVEERKAQENQKAEVKEEQPKVEEGTPQPRIASNTEAPLEYKEVIDVKATAYCLCKKCCGKSEDNPNYGVTRSGLKIIPGTGMKVIAVDPKVIPLGSKVYVEGLNGASDYGYATAADTGSAIKDYKIDLYMDSHAEALKWGRKSVRVYIVE